MTLRIQSCDKNTTITLDKIRTCNTLKLTLHNNVRQVSQQRFHCLVCFHSNPQTSAHILSAMAKAKAFLDSSEFTF
ncbi:hypothetical protein SAMN03097715_01454 [Pseudomonas putida]|nr:hypothetical protein SAMN03097715_01454 [Pseudomonas putida]